MVPRCLYLRAIPPLVEITSSHRRAVQKHFWKSSTALSSTASMSLSSPADILFVDCFNETNVGGIQRNPHVSHHASFSVDFVSIIYRDFYDGGSSLQRLDTCSARVCQGVVFCK